MAGTGAALLDGELTCSSNPLRPFSSADLLILLSSLTLRIIKKFLMAKAESASRFSFKNSKRKNN